MHECFVPLARGTGDHLRSPVVVQGQNPWMPSDLVYSRSAVGKLGVATRVRVAKIFQRVAKTFKREKNIAKFLIKKAMGVILI